MYNILIVDDEPLICEGLNNLLASSGINIGTIFTAHSGYEALDCLRMEEVDLLVTDIQMGTMSGIELMQEAKLIKPWMQTIVISAHETFQYAQMAIRLGAKDYLIKPLNPGQFLDCVRSVLLKMNKRDMQEDPLMSRLEEHFRMEQPLAERDELLNGLLKEAAQGPEFALRELRERFRIGLDGPYYAVIKLKLNLAGHERGSSLGDQQLLKYAALNICYELLEKELNNVSFYSPGDEITVVAQWDEREFNDEGVNKLNGLDMLGRSLHYNIAKYLSMGSVVGISQILKGAAFLPQLNEQACKALKWNRKHPDHYVFYYGDFNWSAYGEPEEQTNEELHAQNSIIVDKAKLYIEEHYAQKGLTLHEVAQRNHVSPNYLSYLFKKETGFNLWEYVIKLRMEESKRLLVGTDMRRYEISERVGYESPEHFSKIFKKYYGISPSELKNGQSKQAQ